MLPDGGREMKSIPTQYRGIWFRSRLEAKWAEHFDDLGVEWLYEPEGYELDGENYLPDFYLPQLRAFVEVKGLLDRVGERKARALARHLVDRGRAVYVVEHPVGARWARVTAEDLLIWRDHGLDACAACGVVQFREHPDDCRVCSNVAPRPDHGPPYSADEWFQIFRWWAEQFTNHGRHRDADAALAEASRLEASR